MSETIEILQMVVGVVFALTFIGAPFLLWKRSRAAALFGAAAGVAYFVTVAIGWLISASARQAMHMSASQVMIIYTLLSGVRNLVFYGCMIGLVLALTTRQGATR